jgi:hypothetical protein
MLSLIGRDHDTAMKKIGRFRRNLDTIYGCPIKVCGSIETTPDGHVHAHGYLYVDGDLDALKLDMDFQAAVDKSGLGYSTTSRIGGDDWFEYAGELAEARAEIELMAAYCAYPTKSLIDDRLRDEFLTLNRQGTKNHLGFQSNAFFRDGVGGEHLNERDAKEQAYERAQQRWRAQGDHCRIEGPVDVEEVDHIANLMFIELLGGIAALQQ